MTQKLKKILCLTLFATLLFFQSCQKDDFSSNAQKNYTINQIPFSELIENKTFASAYSKVSQKQKKYINSKETVMEHNYNFKIANAPANVFEVDSIISYTLLISRDSINEKVVENLIINVNKITQTTNAFILKYESNRKIEILENFNGKKSIFPIIYNPKEYNTSNNNRWYSKCRTVKIGSCVKHPDNPGGPDCDAVIYYETICEDGGSPSDEDYPDSTGSGTDPYGNSQTGGGGSGGTTVVTAPVNPIEQQEREIINKANCEKLNKLTVNKNNLGQPINNNVRDALVLNQQQVTSSNVEQGFRLFMDPTTGNLMPSPIVNTNPQDCGELPFKCVAGMIGFFHSHTAGCGSGGLFEMFSHKDVLTLYKIILNHNTTNIYSTLVDSSNFVMTVATEYGTYALKIADIDAFKNLMAGLYADGKEMGKFLERYSAAQSQNTFNSLGTPIGSSGTNEKNMLNMINDLLGGSVSLHKAKSDFSGWDG